jgi:hypothetical protein
VGHARRGKVFFSGDIKKYIGDWDDDVKCGHGELFLAGGDKYIGEFDWG